MKTAVLTKLAQFADSFGVYVMNAFDQSGYVSFVKISTVDELREALVSTANLRVRVPGFRTDPAFDPTVDAPKPRRGWPKGKKRGKRKIKLAVPAKKKRGRPALKVKK